MPGIPAIYYGSEWGIEGRKFTDSDAPLRPTLDLATMAQSAPHPDLAHTISQLSAIRSGSLALKHGTYQQLYVAHQQFAFSRRCGDEFVVVAVNGSEEPVALSVPVPDVEIAQLHDLLNQNECLSVSDGLVDLGTIEPYGAQILAGRNTR
jgi:glycosidase